MDSFPEHNSNQANQAELTTYEMKEYNVDKLLNWIQQKRRNLLTSDDVKKLQKARISGRVFLMLAGNMEFFENKCNLPCGLSLELVELAREAEREIAEKETASIPQKGKEQGTSTGKSTDHALCCSLYN